jgi:esterase/lipase superfamily enzyme
VRVLFGTNRTPDALVIGRYTAGVAPGVSYGQALVLVPGAAAQGDETFNSLGAATVLERLLVTSVAALAKDDLVRISGDTLRATKVYKNTALVFVHGYGTSFEFALARAGQIARDLAFDGPAFLFSWPSLGKTIEQPSAYGLDQKAASASIDALVEFLATAAQTPGIEKIHIIAHSMGNTVILPALVKIRGNPELSVLHKRIGEVIYASPDVDEAVFKTQVSALAGHGMTLYASAYDKALWLSWWTNLLSRRAGSVSWGLLSNRQPVTVPHLDSIDVSDAGRDWFNANHDVYSANPIVTNDVRRLLQSHVRPPNLRSDLLVEAGDAANRFWVYRAKPQVATPK